MMNDRSHNDDAMRAPATLSPRFDIIRLADNAPVRWRNGQGTTREIVVSPPAASFDTFDWRISIADIEAPGPFSLFPGIDRSLTVIDGAAMELVEHRETSADRAERNERRHPLKQWDTVRFAGEASIEARLPSGSTRDFNLMWRRQRLLGQVDVLPAPDALTVAPGSTVLYVATGSVRIATTRLDSGDAIVMHESTPFTLRMAPIGEDALLIRAHITALPWAVPATRDAADNQPGGAGSGSL